MGFDFIGLIIFALATLLTPGPNNYLLFSHGKNYGYKNSSKLMAGIFCGFVVLLYISGYGISEIILRNPTIALILKMVSSAWLIYLAFALRNLNTQTSLENHSKIGFPHALLMQFINPKAWIVSISGASAFMPDLGNTHWNVFIFTFTFGLIGVPCMLVWISFGDIISKWLNSDKTNRVIGYSIFALMFISVGLIWV